MRRREGGEYPLRCALFSCFPAAGRSGWACAGAAVGDAYVRVVRVKAVRAPRVTAGGDASGRCATRLAPPRPSPAAGATGAGRSPAPLLWGSPQPRVPGLRPRQHLSHASAGGPCLPHAPGLCRRPYSCSPTHFPGGETDARRPQVPCARSLRVRIQRVRIRSPGFPPSYWKLLSSEESRGV